MRGYLEGYYFTVITDQQSLKFFEKLDSPTRRLERWAFELINTISTFNIEKERSTESPMTFRDKRWLAVQLAKNTRGTAVCGRPCKIRRAIY